MVGGPRGIPDLQVMLLVEALCQRAETKLAALPASSSCNHGQLIGQLQQRTTLLASNLSIAEIELNENLRQQEESKAFKGWICGNTMDFCNVM